MNGILIIDKPAGITSHDVVARCRRILKTKRIGHTGTLDPFATGVMVILVGQATRLAQFLDKDRKEYEAVARFGFETDTGDISGRRKEQGEGRKFVSIEQIENVLPEFTGEIFQTPPMYSAKKVDGKKLYELARKGIEIERKPVKVTIYELEIIEPHRTQRNTEEGIKDQKPKTEDQIFRVSCSAGTYIRTLAEDIGKKIGVGAHLAALRRTKAGNFDLSKAVTLEELEKMVESERLDEVLISMNEAVSHLSEIVLSEREIEKTRNGIKLRFENDKLKDDEAIRMIDEKENLVAVGFYEAAEKFVRPRVVLV